VGARARGRTLAAARQRARSGAAGCGRALADGTHDAGLEADRTGRLRRRPPRAQVLQRLASAGAPASWSAQVRDVVELDQETSTRMFGDALPPGLKLLR
jgi:hypothetical protein